MKEYTLYVVDESSICVGYPQLSWLTVIVSSPLRGSHLWPFDQICRTPDRMRRATVADCIAMRLCHKAYVEDGAVLP